jgi:hypothetical protein
MSTPQILTDDQAAAIWSGDTASILDLTPTDTKKDPPKDTPIDTKVVPDDKKVDTTLKTDKNKLPVTDTDLNVWDANADPDSDADGDSDELDTQTQSSKEDKSGASDNQGTPGEPKKGRKPAEIVSLVNQLVEEEVLSGYANDKDEIEPVRTIEEAKALIIENLKLKESKTEEDVWKTKIKSYSPQIQALLHYAEQGGQDISTLMGAIAQAEEASDLTLENEEGQTEIIRQTLKLKGFDDDEIKDQIDTLKDVNKLKSKAEKFLPELTKMQEKRVEMILQEQESRRKEAEDASRIYLTTVQNTLNKDKVGALSLQRQDKAKIFEALAVPKYRSLNGTPVNGFIKSLEEMQFGKNADYDHFTNIVHFAVDKEGFINKLKEELKAELTATTIKKLKTSKSTSANAQDEETSNPQKKNVITRDKFRNPYS